MQTSKEGLESELNQELLATLSSRDQHEVDSLNDDIRRLKQENKMAFAERMRLEAQKNKLENLLTNNLNRRKDELRAWAARRCTGASARVAQFVRVCGGWGR